MDYLYARIRECCAQRWDLLVVGGVVGERWARETASSPTLAQRHQLQFCVTLPTSFVFVCSMFVFIRIVVNPFLLLL